jgi:ketosteroid isomerase-like protein
MSSHKAEISQLLDTYLSAFNNGNLATASHYYHEPAVAISSSGLTLLPTRSDLATFLSATVVRLREDGFDHSEWIGEKNVTVLEAEIGLGDEVGKGLAVAKCGCKRMRKDGTSCEEFTASYTLRRVGGQWLIISIHQYPLGREFGGMSLM